jgi:phosphatidylglycerophosphatase C
MTGLMAGADMPGACAMPRVVVFDFDGVLHRGDAFVLFVRERYRRAPWRLAGLLLCLPWLVPLLLVARPRAIRALIHIGLWGMRPARYLAAVDAFAMRRARQPGSFIREGLRTLRRHQCAGARVIVATGCETTLAKRLLEELGLPDVEVIGSELRAGWFGMRAHYHNYGPRKAQALARAGLAGWHVAYTDAAEDLPLLRPAAECAVLVNPAPKTRRRLERALGTRLRVVHWA